MAGNAAPTSEQVGQYYDEGAVDWFAAMMGDNSHVGYWASADDSSPLAEATDRLTDLMIQKTGVGPGSRVLDVGCGVGGPAIRLARATGAEVVGIAISAEQVRRATALAEATGMQQQVRFQHADAMDLQFPAESFDAVWAFESIMHMPDRQRVLEQIARVLRPGGRLTLTDMFEREPIPADDQPAAAELLKSMESTLASLDDYPRILRAAGLLPIEFVDLTEQTWRATTRCFAEVLRQKEQKSGGRLPAEWDMFRWTLARMSDLTGIGYLILAAQRPTS
jgi:ubiquinone/menaquinone biosynthesis C-methylase UbiE